MDLNPTYTELDLDSDFAIECGMTSWLDWVIDKYNKNTAPKTQLGGGVFPAMRNQRDGHKCTLQK